MAAEKEDFTPQDVEMIARLATFYVMNCQGMPTWLASNGAIEALHIIGTLSPPDVREQIATAMEEMAAHIRVCLGGAETDEDGAPLLSPDLPPPGTLVN